MAYQVQNEYLLFHLEPLAWWAWTLILSLPTFISAAAIYHVIFKSSDWSERAFYLGFVLFSVPFFAIPFVAYSLYEALQIEIRPDLQEVRIQDNTGQSYSAPFQDFKAYAIQTSTESDDDGRAKYTYSLELIRKTGASIHLYETGSADEMKQLLELAKSHLDRPVAGSMEYQLDLAKSLRPGSAGLPSESKCNHAFHSIKSEFHSDGSCILRWHTRAHPAFWPVLFLPFIATYFTVLAWKAQGYSHKWVLILGISFIVLLGLVYGISRSFQATSVVKFTPDGPAIQAYVDSPYFGRFDHRQMLLSEVAYVDASLGESTAITLYDRNPLEGGVLGALDTVLEMKSVMIYTDGLPATDQLKLADLLAASSTW